MLKLAGQAKLHLKHKLDSVRKKKTVKSPPIMFSMAVACRHLNQAHTRVKVNLKLMENSSKFIKFIILWDSRNIYSLLCRYGISYHGAAQAASGTKEQVKQIRDKSKSLFRNIELFGKSNK